MNPGRLVFTLIPLGLFIVCSVYCLRRRRESRIQAPSCGRCDYQVRGLPSFICPECGSDLRDVGIATPEMDRPLISSKVIWTIVVIIFAYVLSTGVLSIFPDLTVQERNETWTIAPVSQAYSNTRFELHAKGYMEKPFTTGKLTLRLHTHDGRMLPLVATFSNSRLIMEGKSGDGSQGASTLEEQDILDWMQDAGLDLENPQIQNEAKSLYYFVGDASRGGGILSDRTLLSDFRASGRSASSNFRPPHWYLPSAFIASLIVWLWGLRVITRKQAAH